MSLHDTHVHLDLLLQKLEVLPEFREISNEEIIEVKSQYHKLANLEINKHLKNHSLVIQSTGSLENFRLIQALFSDNPKIFSLLGSHPEMVNLQTNPEDYLQKQENFYKDEIEFKFLVGIGEVGLDYFYTQDPEIIRIQNKLLEYQIDFAIQKNLPLVIHCREAFKDLLSILRKKPKIQGNFLIHCFTGDKATLSQVLDLGGMVAYGGIITFGKSANYLREVVEYTPEINFVAETDLPFLSPMPKRGETTLPEYIKYVFQKLAELKGISTEAVTSLSEENTRRFFGLVGRY